jgi:hypothetical protein
MKVREYDVKRSNAQYKIENGYVSHIFFLHDFVSYLVII